jgi:hypothetical protein
MRTEKIFTVISMLLAVWITESFAAPSIRSVGTSGTSFGSASRAGSLRSASTKTSSTQLSSNVTTSVSDAADSGTRMAVLPGGTPKVSTPKLPSAGGAFVDLLTGIESRLDDLQAGVDAALPRDDFTQSAVEDLGFETADVAEGKYAPVDALDDYIARPTGGSAGQVLKLTADGVEWGIAGASVQIKTFENDSNLYYCGKTDGATCNVNNKNDSWVAVDMGTIASDGKTGWLRTQDDKVQVCYKETACGVGDTWTDLISLSAYAKNSDLETVRSLANAAKQTAETTQGSLSGYIAKPTGGSAGQVLKLTASGVAWGTVDTPSPNVQLATFDGDSKLYYCGKSGGAVCDTTDSTDGWQGVELSAIQGQDGKDACQHFRFDIDNTYTGTDGTKYDVMCTDED